MYREKITNVCVLEKISLAHTKKAVAACCPGLSGSFVEIHDISNCFLGVGVCLDILVCVFSLPHYVPPSCYLGLNQPSQTLQTAALIACPCLCSCRILESSSSEASED